MSVDNTAVLSTDDPGQVKRVRSMTKGNLTKRKNSIISLLKIPEEDSYDHTKINYTKAKKLVEDYKSEYKTILDLHNRYQMLREEGEDEKLEEDIVEKECNYLEEIRESYYEVIEYSNKFEDSYIEYQI